MESAQQTKIQKKRPAKLGLNVFIYDLSIARCQYSGGKRTKHYSQSIATSLVIYGQRRVARVNCMRIDRNRKIMLDSIENSKRQSQQLN